MPKISKMVPNAKPSTRTGANGRGVNETVLDRIGGWDRLDHSSGLKVNVYGRSGTGKTTFCSTAPKPILYIICSGGNRPGEMRSIDTEENRSVIDPVVLGNSMEIRELISYQERTGKYATVVLDHGSGFQDLVLQEIANLTEIPTQLSWGIATQQTWGQITLQCKEHLRALLSLTCNVIVVAQEREFKSENSSDLILPNVCAAMTPSLTGWLNTAVDYIVNTYIREKYIEKKQPPKTKGGQPIVTRTKIKGEVEYCLRIGPHSVYTTKFRVPRFINEELPESLVDPAFDQMVSLIEGKTGGQPR